METSIHLRRLLATIATLALLGSLVAIAPASVAASGIHSRTITKAGTGSISTGTFTPSAQTGDPLELQDEMAGDEGADNQEAGPDPYDGAISLSSGRGRGASVNSASKAKSNPSFKFGFEGLNHYQQRYSRGGNQFSVEPPDQALCVGQHDWVVPLTLHHKRKLEQRRGVRAPATSGQGDEECGSYEKVSTSEVPILKDGLGTAQP